jgi:hypothetical protein
MALREWKTMADQTHKLQSDPPEGSREVIDHELKRQSADGRPGGKEDKASGADGADRPNRKPGPKQD